MRLTLFCAGVALAIGLAGCSGGTGSSSIPSGPQSGSALSHHGAHLVPVGLHDDYGNYDGPCPGTTNYIYCYWITPGTQFQQEWEEESDGSQEAGTWHWRRSHVYNVQTGHQTNQIRDLRWNPEPGNPSTNTVTVSNTVAPTGGNIGYYFNITVCSNNSPPNPKGYCDGPYPVGIIILSASGS